MSFTREDKEARKFETDPADSSKVVVKTKVENTDSDAVPVKIINTDANIDVEVSVPATISIDDSTPVDVNVTTNPVNTNATIQGTANVNVTNASLATNATIQNSNIDVNLTDLNGSNRLPVSVDNTPAVTVSGNVGTTFTNTNIQAYSYVHNGSGFVFEAADTNGKTINLNHTYYTGTEVTALGSSTDINLWLSAYNDSMLQMKFVETYNAEFEETVYYQHPSLANGTKCLKLIFQYSTENSQTVVKSIFASVADWSYTDDIEGSVAISAGAITSPSPNATISMHTVVTTLTITDNTLGGITLSLSGTNASLYHLHEVQTGAHSQSTMAYVAGRTYQVHAHSDFSGSDYSHSITVTATGDVFGVSASVNIATSGTYTPVVAYSNKRYYKGSTSTGTNKDLEIVGTNINPFANNSSMPDLIAAWSMSFYLQIPSASSNFNPIIAFSATDTRSHFKLFHLNGKLTASFTDNGSAGDYGINMTDYDTWKHIAIVKENLVPRDPNYSSGDSKYFVQIYIDGVAQNPPRTYWDGSPAFSSTDWQSTNVSEWYIAGPARSYTSNGAFASNKCGRQFKVDELSTYSKTLTQSEVTAIYNNGKPHDLMDLAGSYNLEKYFKFGDHVDDVTSGSIKFYDEVNDTIYFSANAGTSEVANINDSVYFPGTAGNIKYVSDAYRGNVTNNLLKGNYTKDVSSTGIGFFPSLESSSAFRSSNNVSYSFYYKLPNANNNFKSVISERYYSTAPKQSVLEIFFYNNELRIYSTYNASRNLWTYTNAVTTGTWNHIVVTTTSADVSTGATVYINGSAVTASSNDTSNTITRTGGYVTHVNFGGHVYNKDANLSTFTTYTPTGNFDFDNFSTWRKTLTASEVTELYNGGQFLDLTTHSAYSDIQRWFRAGEVTNDGTTLYDNINTSFGLASFDSQNNLVDH